MFHAVPRTKRNTAEFVQSAAAADIQGKKKKADGTEINNVIAYRTC